MLDFTLGKWIFEPKKHCVTSENVSIITEPHTDFWQRTYYGFRNDNAPALLLQSVDNFTFTVKANFQYSTLFDQCGLIIYLDSENWFKASIEYENDKIGRLGSVLTNFGYSDWATTDIPLPNQYWYRLSRRGPDFLIESSIDGIHFKQMRIFHLQTLGETTTEMGQRKVPMATTSKLDFGVYACSPQQSSFTAVFSEMQFEPCKWFGHEK